MIGLGSTSQLGIGVALYLQNKFSGPARQIGKDMNMLAGQARNLNRTGSTLQGIGAGMAAIGVAGVMGISKAVKEFTKFEDVMNSVKSISGATAKEYQKLWNSALTMGTPFGQLPEEVAKAQLELAKAGINPKDIERSTKAVLALGAASETAIGGERGAAVMLSDISVTFKKTGEEAMNVANILTSAANRSTIDVKDLYESLKYVGGQAVAMKIPLEEVSAVIATLGNAGLKGSIAGVSYANMLTYLNKATGKFGLKKQKEALAMLGLQGNEFIDMNPNSARYGSLKSMSEIMGIIAQRTKNMLPKDKQMVFDAIFGVRAKKMVDRMVDSLDDYDQMLKNINEDNSQGVAMRVAQEKTNDLAGDIAKLKAQWSQFLISVGKAFEPFLRTVIPLLTKGLEYLTNFINNSSAGKGLVVITGLLFALLVPLGAVVTLMGTMMTLMGSGRMFGLMRMMVGGRAAMAAGSGGIGAWLSRLVMGDAVKRTMANGATRWASRSTGRFMAGSAVPLSARLFSSLGVMLPKFLGILGTVIRGLTSWPVLIADLASTMLFGHGLFEYLWEAIKNIGDGLYEIFNFGDFRKMKEEALNWIVPFRRQGLWDGTKLGRDMSSGVSYLNGYGNKSFAPSAGQQAGYISSGFDPEADRRARLAKEWQSSHGGGTQIQLNVYPTQGDKTTRYNINSRDQSSLNAFGMK